jgi:hypothetical protein
VKVTKTRGAVYRLRINQRSFEVLLDAIHILSIKTQRFETLASVITAGAQHAPRNTANAIADLETIRPLDGDIKVFVRLTSDRHKNFEDFRALLEETGGRSFGVRDAIMICALLIASRK